MKRKAKVTRSTITLIILVIAVFLIAGTYARYSSVGEASASTNLAKWSVAITSNNLDLTTATQDITFTVQNNSDVVAGKIAPGSTATATVNLDLTGTEVAVDFDATIDTEAYNASNVGASFDKLTLTTKLGDTVLASGISQLIPLVNDSAFTSENGQKTVTLTLAWENDDTNNADDTAMGLAGQTITIPITFTARQHVLSDISVLTTAVAGIEAGGTVTLTDNVDVTQYERIDGGTPGQVLNFPDNATLDLNGRTITTRNMAVSYQGDNLTIENGNFEAEIALKSGAQNFETTGKGSYGLFLWDNDNDSHGITVRNVKTTGGINIYKAYNVVLENCDVTATNFYAVYGNAPSSVTINSGTYRAGAKALFGYCKSEDGESNVSDGFKIYGGTFITGNQPFCLDGNNYAPVIYGGTFDKNVSAYVASGYECVADPDNAGMYIVRAQ